MPISCHLSKICLFGSVRVKDIEAVNPCEFTCYKRSLKACRSYDMCRLPLNLVTCVLYACSFSLEASQSSITSAQSKPQRTQPKPARLIELVCDSGVEGRTSSQTPLNSFNPEPYGREPAGETSSGIFGGVSTKGR